MNKIAYIKKMPNGRYRVLSKKHKNLGECDSKEEAEERLRQVEYFKHKEKKALEELSESIKKLAEIDVETSLSVGEIFNMISNDEGDETYSSLIRKIRKERPEDIKNFMKRFKELFEQAVDAGVESPEEAAILDIRQEFSI